MPTESAVATRIAAAAKRLESMSLLSEILSGQLERQRREFRELKAAIALPGGQEQRSQSPPAEISADMLAG